MGALPQPGTDGFGPGSGRAVPTGPHASPHSGSDPDVGLFQWWLARRGTPYETDLAGASMGAAMPDGARIRIAAHPGGEYRVGQVVAFLAGRRIMVHRVVHVGRSVAAHAYLITQGDGNWICDPPIAREAVAGTVGEYCVGDVWQVVRPARLSPWRRMVSAPVLYLSRGLLERDPARALRLARMISRLRMRARRVAVLIGLGRHDHVRD